MLPISLNFHPRNRKEKAMEAEKSVALLESIIGYISLLNEQHLDQFEGTGNFAIVCLNAQRNAVVIEKDETTFEKIKDNVMATLGEDDEGKAVIEP